MRMLALALVACNAPNAGPDAPPAPDAPNVLASCSNADPAASLRGVVNVQRVTTQPCGAYVRGQSARCFDVELDQPIDHADPGGIHFTQHAFVIHRSCDAATIVADWGYSQDLFFDTELTVDYATNAVWIEHRFQGNSAPNLLQWPWETLTIQNGAADMHAIITAMRAHYTGRWLSTGASKGGITATYHRYFFPADVDGSVPYVAPASRQRIDPAYQTRMHDVLPDPCAQAIRDVQVAALTTRKQAMLDRLAATAPGQEETYLELLMATFDWGFWQYTGISACGQVPTASSTDDQFFQFVNQISNAEMPATMSALSDGSLDYEWLTEQGFALQVGDHVMPYLHDPYATETMEQRFRDEFPDAPLPDYNGAVTTAVRAWMPTADHMLLVYGDYDPWSGGALDAPAGDVAAKYYVPHATHGAQISALGPTDRPAAMALVSTMLAQDPDPVMAAAARRAGADQLAILSALERGVHLRRLARAARK
jgi:hypothetical protein